MDRLTVKEVYENLSEERRRVYDFIRAYARKNGGNVPPLRDIAHYMGTYVSSAHYHVNVLKSFGLLAGSSNTNGYMIVGARFSVDFGDFIQPSVGKEKGHDIFGLAYSEINGETSNGRDSGQRKRGRAVREAEDIRWFRQRHGMGQ